MRTVTNGYFISAILLIFRFRSTFLSLGGGCHPAEIFRRFRGRDPSPDALTELYGISTQGDSDNAKWSSQPLH